MRTQVPIADGFYVDESLAVSARRCMNLYPHIPEGRTVTQGALFGISGIEQIALAEEGSYCRGGIVMGEKPYMIYGEKLYRIDFSMGEFQAVDVSGTEFITGSERVFVSDNGTEICIVAPELDTKFNAWIYTEADGLEKISDSDFDGPAASVTYSDGYFVFSKKDSNVWFVSDLRDGETYIATDFASAEADPDDVVVTVPLRGLVYVFGASTVEQYQNAGGAGFPYVRVNSGTYNKGCVAPHSVVEVNNSLIFIGGGENERPAVWATNGGEPIKISPPSIDTLIYSGGADAIRNAFAVRWLEAGHNFVAFTVPGVCTVVYDQSTGLWHERSSHDVFLLNFPWRVAVMLDAYSEYIVGDSVSPNIGRFSKEIVTEYENEIKAYFDIPQMDNDGRPFSVYAFEVLMDTGNIPIGLDPKVRLSVSKDGGRTHLPPITRSVGLIGQFRNRIYWPSLGRFDRSFTARISITAPIKRYFVKGEIEIGA